MIKQTVLINCVILNVIIIIVIRIKVVIIKGGTIINIRVSIKAGAGILFKY